MTRGGFYFAYSLAFFTASAQAIVVFPQPPFPVTIKSRRSRNDPSNPSVMRILHNSGYFDQPEAVGFQTRQGDPPERCPVFYPSEAVLKGCAGMSETAL